MRNRLHKFLFSSAPVEEPVLGKQSTARPMSIVCQSRGTNCTIQFPEQKVEQTCVLLLSPGLAPLRP